jgi:hypothetical protein
LTKHVVPDAIPYIDRARAEANILEVGLRHTPWSFVPGPIAAAVSELESGDDPFGVGDSPDGAVGPMQVTPAGWEAGEWNAANPPFTVGSAADLRDIQHNYDVGVFGLSRRYDRLVDQGFGHDWFLAATTYFGCDPLPSGEPDPNCGDVYSNAAGYYNHLTQYTDTMFGHDVTDALQHGVLDEGTGQSVYDTAWAQTGGGYAHAPSTDCGYTDIACWVGKLPGLVVGQLFGSIGAILPRIGIAVLGLGIGIIGIKALLS